MNDPSWEVKLSKMHAYGNDGPHPVDWPAILELMALDLTKTVKLTGIELRFDKELCELRLTFTGGVKSVLLRSSA